MSKFEVCEVEDRKDIVERKLFSEGYLQTKDVEKVLRRFDEYNDAYEYMEDLSKPAVLVEVFEEEEETRERTICDECDFQIITNSNDRYNTVKRKHIEFHQIEEEDEEIDEEDEEEDDESEEDEEIDEEEQDKIEEMEEEEYDREGF